MQDLPKFQKPTTALEAAQMQRDWYQSEAAALHEDRTILLEQFRGLVVLTGDSAAIRQFDEIVATWTTRDTLYQIHHLLLANCNL